MWFVRAVFFSPHGVAPMGHNPHKSVSRLLYTPRRQKVTLTGKERPPPSTRGSLLTVQSFLSRSACCLALLLLLMLMLLQRAIHHRFTLPSPFLCELSLAVDALKGLWSRVREWVEGRAEAATKWRLSSFFPPSSAWEHDEVLYRKKGNPRFPRWRPYSIGHKGLSRVARNELESSEEGLSKGENCFSLQLRPRPASLPNAK